MNPGFVDYGVPTGYVPRPTKEASPDPLKVQISGDHYRNLPIQPIEYIHANGLNFLEGNVVKYITRHRTKNGAEDVRKALHYCQLLLKLEYSCDA